MSNITVSTDSNFDDAGNLALTNGDDILIDSGATLTVNSDVRWAQNAAVIGQVTIDDEGGGTLKVDGTTVWWLPYDTGTGNVPAIGTTITGDTSGATGELIGTFTGLGVNASTVGGAMPASGYIKLRTKTGTFQSETLTGIGASATGAGERGWIHFVGEEDNICLIAANGTFDFEGDWFELGTSDGTTGQTFQYYVSDYCPAIWVETGSGTGVYEVWAASYEWAAGDIGTALDEAGRFFNCTSAGVIALGTGTVGAVPPNGAKIRVPNIHVSNSSSTDWTANTLDTSSFNNRWNKNNTTTGIISGSIELSKCNWNATFDVSFYTLISFENVGIANEMIIENSLNPLIIDNLGVGQAVLISGANPIELLNLNNTVITNSVFGFDSSFCRFNNLNTLFVENCIFHRIDGTSTSGTDLTVFSSKILGGTFKDCAYINGLIYNSNLSNVTFENMKVGDRPGAKRAITRGIFYPTTTLNDNVINGFSLIDSCSLPSQEVLFQIEVWGWNPVIIKNVGTHANPLDFEDQFDYLYKFSNSVNTISKVIISRVYFENLDIGTFTDIGPMFPTASSCTIQNVRDESDENSFSDSAGYIGSNTIIRGCRFSGSMPTVWDSITGCHFYDYFTSDTVGRMGLLFSEKIGTEPSNSSYTFDTGTPTFNQTGNMYMVSGDIIIYEWQHYILGYTGLTTATTITNCTIEYDIDKNDGNGYTGSWTTATAGNLGAETGISATNGFKLKIRLTATGAVTANSFYITGATDATSQLALYDLTEVDLILSNLVVGSRYWVYDLTDMKELEQAEATSTTETISIPYNDVDYDVEIRVRKSSSGTKYIPFKTQTTITEDGATAYISQVEDTIVT